METEPQVETHSEVTSSGQKATFVEHIKEKISAVKEKITGHHDHHSSPADDAGHEPDVDTGREHDHASSTLGGASPRGAVASHPKIEDEPRIPAGGLIMTAAPEEPEATEEHHRLREKIKNVFSFPVPDTTVTPEKDFDETVPPNLQI